MAKVPPLPHDLMQKTLTGEPCSVIGAFTNIILFWIDRGIKEPLPEHKIRGLSLLPSNLWAKYETRLKTMLDEFYGPFIEHWHKVNMTHGRFKERATKAGLANVQAKAKKAKAIAELQKTQPQPLLDESQEFSRQPHTIDRIYQRTTRFVDDTPQLPPRSTKKKPPVDFKPGLKDG